MKSHGGLFSAFAVFAAGLPFHFGKIVKVLLSARQGAGQGQGPAVRFAALRQASAPAVRLLAPSAAGLQGGPWAAPKCIVALTFITFGNDFVTEFCHQRAACADLSGR